MSAIERVRAGLMSMACASCDRHVSFVDLLAKTDDRQSFLLECPARHRRTVSITNMELESMGAEAVLARIKGEKR